MRKSLGDKRREIPTERAQDILRVLADCRDGDTRRVTRDGREDEVAVSHVFPTTHFGFRKVTVERPLRLNFQVNEERLARLETEKGFQALAQSKKKGAAGAREQQEGSALQGAIRRVLRGLPGILIKDRDEFERLLDSAAKKSGVKLPAPARKAILSALSERDETASICRGRDGNPEPDPELRDSESVPLPPDDDPVDAQGVAASVRTFFEREVKPHVPDAWIDTSKRDTKDGKVGLVGYEINFNRYFYRYTPPRPLEEIEADIRAVEQDIVRMLSEITGTEMKGAKG
jgi:type I restriction enzyme M protein